MEQHISALWHVQLQQEVGYFGLLCSEDTDGHPKDIELCTKPCTSK